MPRPSIDQVRSLSDHASTFHWKLGFFSPPRIGTYPGIEELDLRCVSTSLPKVTIGQVPIKIRGHTVQQPGDVTYNSPLTLTFVETVDNVIANFFRQWREACWQSKTGAQGAKADVEAIIQIMRLNRQDVPIWGYKLVGCTMADSDFGTLGPDQGAIQPTISIAFDYFEDVAV